MSAKAPLALLFIGNSYTYYNNLPCLVAEFARSRGHDVDIAMSAPGGQDLAGHRSNARTQDFLSRRTWTHVILQAQSTFGVTFLVDGLERVADVSPLERHAMPLAAQVKEAGGRPILFEHWKRRDAPERDGLALRAAFASAAAATRADVAPVGRAWALVSRERPHITLYDADGSHPSFEGSYLAAATLYAALSGEPASGLPESVTCPDIDPGSGTVADAPTDRGLDRAVASALQGGAGAALREWSPTPPDVPPMVLPELPEGEPLGSPAPLAGVWDGELTLYPRWVSWPATLSLVVSKSAETVRLTVGFGGKPDDIVRNVRLSLDRGTIRFVDPDGPNGTKVEYRGTLRGDTLQGIAEFRENPSLSGIGTWRVERRR